MCGLRVLRDGGFPLDFRASFVRNIVRIMDFLPSFYGTGALCMFASKESKRLGDYAAGTIVVADASATDWRRLQAQAQPPPPLPTYEILGDPALLTLRALTRKHFAVVEHFLARRTELPREISADLAAPNRHPFVLPDRLPSAGGGVPL